MAIEDTGPVEGIDAFIYCTKWRSGQVLPMPCGRTDRLTLKDRATLLLIKYKSGALVTQFFKSAVSKESVGLMCLFWFYIRKSKEHNLMDYLATAWCPAWIKSIFVRCRYYAKRNTLLAEALKPQNATNVTLAFNCKCELHNRHS